MTTFVYDQLTDSVDWRTGIYSPAYHQFLERGGDDLGDFDGCSVSPSGTYVAGGGGQDTVWLAKTTPAGSPTKIMDQPFEGVTWSGDVTTHTDIIVYAVDDEGFIYGIPYLESTSGNVGYIDPDNPTLITRAFKFTDNGDIGGDPDGFNIGGIFTFTMPDASIRVLVFPAGTQNPYVYDHTKGSGTYTLIDTGGSWVPSWCFQDDNGDLWICGADQTANPTTEINFKRITNVTGSSTYASSLSGVAVPSTVTYSSIPVGYFAGGYFIGGWNGDVQAGAVTACSHVFKINLTSGAMTSADFSADPIRFPRNPSPPDPTYYFVFKASDLNLIHGSMSRVFYDLQTDLTLGQTYNLDQWNANDEGGNLSGLDDVYTQFWADGRQAFIGQRYQNLDDVGAFDPTGEIIERADLFIYYFGDGSGVENVDTILRVWGFSLDGHDFYVLRLGGSGTLVYDLTTDTWSEWASPDQTKWRAHIGQNWVGMAATTFAHDYGSDVVAGDDTVGVLWVLDPTAGQDDDATTGDPTSFTRKVTGELQVSGRDVMPCGAVTLDLSVGNPISGSVITLKTSDDLGNSFRSHDSLSLTASNFNEVVEWRGLGLIRAPGRIFEINDSGAAIRISAANMR